MVGSGSRTLVPPNRTNRPSPGSFDRVIPESGRFRMPPPESLVSSGDSCTAGRVGFRVPLREGAQLQPAAVRNFRIVFECGLVHEWGICGSGPYDVASMFAKICCVCLPSGDCNFSCARTRGQLKLFGCPVFDVAPVLSGRRAVCQGGELRHEPRTPLRSVWGITADARELRNCWNALPFLWSGVLYKMNRW